MTRKKPGHFQLVVREQRWNPCDPRFHCPDPGLIRYIVFDPDPTLTVGLFDGLFRRDVFFGPTFGPWPPEQIIGRPYILYLGIYNNQISSWIRDKATRRNLRTIRYTPPGGLKRYGHVLGLSCFGTYATEAVVLHDNVYLCF